MGRRFVLAMIVGGVVAALMPVAAWATNGRANYRAVCPAPPRAHAGCHVLVVTDAHGNPKATTAPTGLSPATIKAAYGFPTSVTAGAGETVAIVDAYDDPTAERDLGVFSSQFGLPSCTTANGCFSKVDQTGGTSYPTSDQGWALEISLDVQWAHAVAPGAKILLVEANSNSFADLMAAEDYAKAHAQYVSNSWGGSEFSGESSYDFHFVQQGVSFFVSAGDNGLPAEFPSSSPQVISVGGTTLNFDSSGNLLSETGWSSGGGGCSTYETATTAQSVFSGYPQANCYGARATPDVALDADPNSGVSVYDSTPYYGQTGWFKVGGTSASSPMWAARSADAGVVVDASYVYGGSIAFRDITSGNNGAPCLVGYDLCSGRGSWTGGGATQPSGPTISSFAPSSGPPGTQVVINGSGFTGAGFVGFNGTSASFSVDSDSSITATVPAGAGSGPITITTPSGSATSSSSFGVASAVADLASSYQIDPAHDGVQSNSTLAPPLAQRWSVALGNTPSYPLIADGNVYVTVANTSGAGSTLEALAQADGHLVWSQPIAGTYGYSAAAYDNGQVFVINYDGLLQAFNATTGASAWSNQLPGQWAFTSPPTAADGAVYVGGAGSGGTLYVVDELSGGLLATQPVMNGDHSSPALSASDVFVSYACNQAYGFAQTSLDLLWHYTPACEGGGGKTVAYAGARVYTRDPNGNLILDAASGGLLGSWTPSATAALAPAVDQTSVYALTWPSSGGTHTLSAQNLSDGTTRWSFTGDGQLDTAPIVLSGPSGEFVVEGSASGALSLLRATDGSVAWSTNLGASIPQPDEQNVSQLSGLAAGQGLLVVPAGTSLYAYAAAATTPAPTISSFTPTSGPAGTNVTITGSNLTGATAVSFNGTSTSFNIDSDTQITATVPNTATSGPIRITTPGGSTTSSASFTVTTPDFSLTATPTSQTVVAGNSTSYTITVTAAGGLAGSVDLTVSGLPTGVTASFNPASTTNSSTLTIQTSRNAKPGSTTLTITGSSGNLTHTTSVTLQIKKK